jgi:tetratricopeptide (TPR) repeat protein
MAREDIDKLKEKLAKNPDSKLFVPLAEEYRKAEMFDEAIAVLKQGLELQPSYMSARVALGKIYCEKDMLTEAKSEFEQVIKTIPDNLFAHKKLAEILRGMGNPVMALQQYETVLKMNPLDDEAREAFDALTSSVDTLATSEDAGGGEEAQAETSPPEEDEHVAEGTKSPTEVQPMVEEVPAPDRQGPSPDEVVAERDVQPDTVEESIPVTERDSAGVSSPEEVMPAEGEITEEAAGIKEDELGEEFKAFASAIQSDAKPSDAGSDDVPTTASEDESEEAPMFYTEESTVDSARDDFEIRNKEHILPDEEAFLGKEDSGITEQPDSKEGKETPVQTALLHAEELVSQSKFSEAVRYYNNLAEQYPDDKKIPQKLQELKAYLKMLGKDKEEVINRLERLLSGIKLAKEKR